MPKKTKTFRFKPELYNRFKTIVANSGYTLTSALERFMTVCIEQNQLVFPEGPVNVDVEARILLSWLRTGRFWYYRSPGDKEETNVRGRLLQLLPQINGKRLKAEVELALRNEQAKNWVDKLSDKELIETLRNLK